MRIGARVVGIALLASALAGCGGLEFAGTVNKIMTGKPLQALQDVYKELAYPGSSVVVSIDYSDGYEGIRTYRTTDDPTKIIATYQAIVTNGGWTMDHPLEPPDPDPIPKAYGILMIRPLGGALGHHGHIKREQVTANIQIAKSYDSMGMPVSLGEPGVRTVGADNELFVKIEARLLE
jgi:hypothetical protein